MERRERIPRWLVAVGVWITLALVSVVGWGFQDYKMRMEGSIDDLEKRILILERAEASQSATLEGIRTRLIEIQMQQRRQQFRTP